MVNADSAGGGARQSSVSVLIAGAGIMGLWAAAWAERLGIDALVVDGQGAGRGASGGLLGALMPHMPDRWNDKKQFQFDALLSLEDEASAIEAATGLDVGYRRCGRLIPLPKPHLRTIALRHAQDATTSWRAGDRQFAWQVIDQTPFADWPQLDGDAAGLVHDTFAARVSPRGLVGALVHIVRDARHVRLLEGLDVVAIDPAGRVAQLSDGSRISFGHVVVAAGHRAFALLESLVALPAGALGQPVKGQAALLAGPVPPELPVIFLDGLYIVPHEGGHVAVGSTSENSFTDAVSTDAQLEDLISRACQVAPVLEQCAVIERWAGLRPKATERDPMIGPLPEYPHVLALTGGFKVSFGLAHRLAEAVVAGLAGGAGPVLPRSFSIEAHLELATRKS